MVSTTIDGKEKVVLTISLFKRFSGLNVTVKDIRIAGWAVLIRLTEGQPATQTDGQRNRHRQRARLLTRLADVSALSKTHK